MADKDVADTAVDTEALPETKPHPAPAFDTGAHALLTSETGSAVALADRDSSTGAHAAADTADDADGDRSPRSEPLPVLPAVVPGRHHVLKWWKLVLVFLAVWIPAAGVGLGLFYWWFQLADKTPAVFVALVFVVVCTVAALMLSMVRDNPLIAGLSLAMMSAVFAAMLAAAPLYGHYYCQHVSRCAVGILPY